MRTCDHVECILFPCLDVQQQYYVVPNVDLDPGKISLVLISEAAPANPGDYYYAAGEPLFQQTTLQAFQDAGVKVGAFHEILEMGVYLTTAVKCAKKGYGLQTSTIEECSRLLEAELALFPKVQAYLLMGDVAIKAVNTIARRSGQPRVIPAGPTYKLRGQAFFFHGKPVFPSYLQAGPSFFIEKSKRKMIAEDIASALSLVR